MSSVKYRPNGRQTHNSNYCNCVHGPCEIHKKNKKEDAPCTAFILPWFTLKPLRLFYKTQVERGGAVALNVVDSVRLLYMRRIDSEYISHLPFLKRHLQPETYKKFMELCSEYSVTTKAELRNKRCKRNSRIGCIKVLEKALTEYEKRNKKIMMYTATPVCISTQYKAKVRTILKHTKSDLNLDDSDDEEFEDENKCCKLLECHPRS